MTFNHGVRSSSLRWITNKISCKTDFAFLDSFFIHFFVQFFGCDFFPTYAPLAQLVEHLTLNQGVRGSSPRWFTNKSLSQEMRRAFVFRRISAGARWGRKNASAFLFAYGRKYNSLPLQANQTALCGCLSGRRAKRRAPDGPPTKACRKKCGGLLFFGVFQRGLDGGRKTARAVLFAYGCR